jgi:hypothetical protein
LEFSNIREERSVIECKTDCLLKARGRQKFMTALDTPYPGTAPAKESYPSGRADIRTSQELEKKINTEKAALWLRPEGVF